MSRKSTLVVLPFLLLCSGLATAQSSNSPACVIMKGLDLKPLLGADHDAPVNFGQDSCRAESKGPGKLIALAVLQGTAAEHQKMLAMVKQINTTQRAKEVKVVAEPSLGNEAFSIRDNDMRQIEIMAIKGSRSINLQGGNNKPLSEAEVKQLVALAKAALDKLP